MMFFKAASVGGLFYAHLFKKAAHQFETYATSAWMAQLFQIRTERKNN
jgi:hypothetical protein